MRRFESCTQRTTRPREEWPDAATLSKASLQASVSVISDSIQRVWLRGWICAENWAVMREREFFIDNLLVRIHCIIVMIRWTGLAPWEFEFPFPGSQRTVVTCHRSTLSTAKTKEQMAVVTCHRSHVETLILYKLGFNQNYYIFA